MPAVKNLKSKVELNHVFLAGKLIVSAATDLTPTRDKEGNLKGFHCDQYSHGYGIPIEIDEQSYGIYVSKEIYEGLHLATKGLEYVEVMVEGKLTPGNDVYNGKNFVYPIVMDATTVTIVRKQEI